MRFSDCQVVHRDLASRNVLLAEGMICKVSDFGMSRDVYVDQSYTKLGHGKGRISTIGRSIIAASKYSLCVLKWGRGREMGMVGVLGPISVV